MAKTKQPQPLSDELDALRDVEAVRITLIHCLDMLGHLREKMPNAVPKEIDPHGIYKSWLATAERHLIDLLRIVVENEP